MDDFHDTSSIATVVICQGSWCRLATAPGQELRPKALGQASGFCSGSERLDFRFANCLGLCGQGANAKLEMRNTHSPADKKPAGSTFLRNVHMLQDGDWLRIFKALRSRTPVNSVVHEQHHVTPADPAIRTTGTSDTGPGA
jgi:hypothetical protein